VVILTPLAPQDGGTSRHPGPLDTGLHEPYVVVVSVAVALVEGGVRIEQRVAIEVEGFVRRAVVLLVLIQAIGKQARRNVQDRGADLEDFGIFAIGLIGCTSAAKDGHIRATCIAKSRTAF